MVLKNKKVILTGVSKGIGLATLKALLNEGAIVAGWGRTKPDVDHTNFYFYEVDIRNNDQVEKVYQNTVNDLEQSIDILVNNAGLGFESPIEETDLELWKAMFDTNVHGLFYCSKSVIPRMKAMEKGHIINIASIAGTTGIPNMAGYCGTKHAVKGISHAMYKELRNYGIKVTCIYPGSVKTNFFDKIDSVQVNDNMMMPEDIAGTILHVLRSSENYHHVDIEVRPLRPKGRKG